MATKRLQEQRVDNRSSNDDLKRSINTLPTSSTQNPAPNPFIVGRKPVQNGGNGNPSNTNNGLGNQKA
jgi:hypothetical protein